MNVLDQIVLLGDYAAIDAAGYSADSDLNRDGVVNTTDLYVLLAEWGAGEAAGALSNSTVRNTIGFSGYAYHAPTQTYCVRMRWFDTKLGRWIERDPLGYVDGMNTYEYAQGRPLKALDPYGLNADDEALERWDELPDWVKEFYNRHGIKRPGTLRDATWDPEDHVRADERRQARNQRDLADARFALEASGLVIGMVTIVLLPGPEDGIMIIIGGVRFVRLGREWFELIGEKLRKIDDVELEDLEKGLREGGRKSADEYFKHYDRMEDAKKELVC